MRAATGKTAFELIGAGEPPANTRQRLVHTALDLFYRHGFHAVGIDQVIDAVGVTKTTFYNHFESKDELIVEAIATRDRWEREAWARLVSEKSGGDPRRAMLALFDVLDDWFNLPDFLGCMFINASAEFPVPHDPIHRAAAEHAKANERWIAQTARSAGLRDPERLAEKWVLLLEGAITCRQMTGKDSAAATARAMAEAVLREHEAPPV